MTLPTASPLSPRLDQLARLLALGWSDERIAGETGLSLRGVYGARSRLRRTWGLVGRAPDSPASWAAVVLGGAVRSYVAAHPLPPARACLHCPAVPVLRAAAGSETGWELRERARLCRSCWRQWIRARSRP